MSYTSFECQECGKDCKPKEFHDFIECIRYRWSSAAPRDGSEGHERRELNRAESDIKSLLAALDIHADQIARSEYYRLHG